MFFCFLENVVGLVVYEFWFELCSFEVVDSLVFGVCCEYNIWCFWFVSLLLVLDWWFLIQGYNGFYNQNSQYRDNGEGIMYMDMNCDQFYVGVFGGEVSVEQDVIVIVFGQLCVIKCNGKVVFYDDDKIIVVIIKVFLVVEGGIVVVSLCIYDIVDCFIEQVSVIFKCCMFFGGIIYIEEIQDQVELVLMCNGEYKVVCDYVLYCDQQVCKCVECVCDLFEFKYKVDMIVIMEDGSCVLFDMVCLEYLIYEVCSGFEEVYLDKIIVEIVKNLYDGVFIKDVNIFMVMIVCIMIEMEFNYFQVIVWLLMDKI